MKTQQVRAAVALASAVVVAAAAAACSSGSHPAPHVPGAMIDPPIGKVFNGVTLAGMLGKLTYPAGFSPDAQALANSGLVIAPNQDLSILTSQTCSGLATALGNYGFGESSFAANGAMTGDYGRGLAVAVYQFGTDTQASVFYSTVKSMWSACGSFTDDSTGVQQPTAMIAAPAPAVWGTSKAVDLSLSQTLDGIENATDYVMSLDGDTVVLGRGAGYVSENGLVQ